KCIDHEIGFGQCVHEVIPGKNICKWIAARRHSDATTKTGKHLLHSLTNGTGTKNDHLLVTKEFKFGTYGFSNPFFFCLQQHQFMDVPVKCEYSANNGLRTRPCKEITHVGDRNVELYFFILIKPR